MIPRIDVSPTCANALEAKVAADGIIILTDNQVAALERKQQNDEVSGEIETAHPEYPGSQDTFYIGNLAFAKLHTTKTPITAERNSVEKLLPIQHSSVVVIVFYFCSFNVCLRHAFGEIPNFNLNALEKCAPSLYPQSYAIVVIFFFRLPGSHNAAAAAVNLFSEI